MTSENEVMKDLKLLIEVVIGNPKWYQGLTEERKKRARPILDEMTKAVKKYYLELRPLSKDEALSYINEVYKRIDDEIRSIENGELQELLRNHSDSVLGTILEYKK